MSSRLVSVAFSCCVLAFSARPASADVLKVPQQFETIPDAITAAAPGDEILISPGTYDPFAISLKTDLTVRAKGKVVIDGPTMLVSGGAVAVFDCTRVHLRGLRVQVHGPGDGVSFFGATDCDATACRVDGATTGFASGMGSGTALVNCHTTNCNTGAALVNAGGVRVVGCKFMGSDQLGIHAQSPAAEIRDNVVRCEGGGGIGTGGECNAVIADNTVSGAATAFVVSADTVLTIIGNRVRDCQVGLDGFGDACAVIDNRFDDLTGIVIHAANPGMQTARNQIRRCGTGLLIGANSDEGTHVGNSIKNCTANGVQILVGAEGNLIAGNVVKQSGSFDLSDESGGANTLLGNKFGTVGIGP